MQTISKGINSLFNIVDRNHWSKLFVVAGSSYTNLKIKDEIDSLQISKIFFNGFTPNPLFEQVCAAVDLFIENGCDSILAVGGGSAIDVAKCLKLAVLAKEGKKSLMPSVVSNILEINGKDLPFVAIPTTAGSGSESTHNAVLYYDNVKQTITNDGILPNYAILDSLVLKTLPLYQKKCTMLDALCQAIESWWSVNSTDKSIEYSKKAVKLIISNWESYIFKYTDEVADNIMLAANYAGRAINIAQTTSAHAMSYKITSMYNLPHGHSVAVCLPYIWDYMIANIQKCIDTRGCDYLSDTFYNIADAMQCNNPNEAISRFRSMLEIMEIDLPVSKKKDEDIEVLSKSVNPIRLKNNPIELNEHTILQLYGKIIK
ncbi:MAG: phosphonoacetaldehyde reductase [Candidatus Cryptobacteroides sp.]